ncbi:hypothetical protein V6Z12_A05G101400 [Gossypium hirsutum]
MFCWQNNSKYPLLTFVQGVKTKKGKNTGCCSNSPPPFQR